MLDRNLPFFYTHLEDLRLRSIYGKQAINRGHSQIRTKNVNYTPAENKVYHARYGFALESGHVRLWRLGLGLYRYAALQLYVHS